MAEAGVDLTDANGRAFINACVDAELEYKALLAQAIEDACAAGVDLHNVAGVTFWPLQGAISWDDANLIAEEPGAVYGTEEPDRAVEAAEDPAAEGREADQTLQEAEPVTLEGGAAVPVMD